MLSPENRLLLTDGLRPPEGARLDAAVGTTYSLNLTAMLLAPLSFAFFDVEGDPAASDAVRLMEAARRYSERMVLYCQAGNIVVPDRYTPVLKFVEDSVVEVIPESGAFHPKLWALRFLNESVGSYSHRLLIMSRNQTFDRSWDTILRLDEDSDHEAPIPTGPLVDFLAQIPGIAVGGGRPELVSQLCETLVKAKFAPPSPFRSAEFIPRGFGKSGYPFPSSSDRALLISPYLSGSVVRDFDNHGNVTLISRPESFDRIGRDGLIHVDSRVIHPSVESDLETGETNASDSVTRITPKSGLHAKTFIFDTGSAAQVITGSANLTQSGWTANVEFSVRMDGPVSSCGVAATLESRADSPGLERLLEEYKPENNQAIDGPNVNAWHGLATAHCDLAAAGPYLTARDLAEKYVTVDLRTERTWVDPGKTEVTLLTLRKRPKLWTSADPIASWDRIVREALTPYLLVTTTVRDSTGDEVTRSCVIKAKLTGDVWDRTGDVVAEIFKTKEDVLRYLVLLLGDPTSATWAAEMVEQDADGEGQSNSVSTTITATEPNAEPAPRGRDEGILTESRPMTISDYGAGVYGLFELLIRATGRDDIAIERVASLIDELKALDSEKALIPEGFEELWETVWQVHKEVVNGG